MRIRIIAVGERMPPWVDEVVGDYTRRLSGSLKVAVSQVPAGQRSARAAPAQAMQAEARRILELLKPQEFLVALDEHGAQLSTRELANWLAARMNDGRDVAFVIGGPDGLASEVMGRADFKLSLSKLTLPHALVRVVLAEQLYRAHSVLAGHPYHRD
ncbi:MAG TPA: 23S rRNA (pseudouridine(1915)-N(3))-methyltransferase RlmH [Steroidobacteraceae bacterium]|nr:23S rRNA (pseudouridine(1915)-N(3))-methyltransferase RlmH [Steroidobacteraceae bacterium]